MSEQVPSIGRIVHYVLDAGPHAGEQRPAVIVRVWGEQPDSLVNLQVFTDSDQGGYSNDALPPVWWRESRKQDPTGRILGTWHWPEKA